ncbi:MAG: acylglycerol kinase family protein [bacterium]|nr:acylglycerol kinase family protein [bacterium]
MNDDALPFENILIIANPKSRRHGDKKAGKLREKLLVSLPEIETDIFTTKGPDHARTLAYLEAKNSSNLLIISASGDGTYNEVVNGIKKADRETGRNTIAAVFKAGNANDHYRSLHRYSLDQLVEKVRSGLTREIDLLKLVAISENGTVFERFAHSYIGFGITAQGADYLNKHHPRNSITELKIVPFLLKNRKTFEMIDERGNYHKLDSLTFHNTRHMAKWLEISSNGNPADGLFEIITIDTSAKAYPTAAILRTGIQGAFFGLKEQPQAPSYSLDLVGDDSLVQLDGERMMLSADSHINISIIKAIYDLKIFLFKENKHLK